RGRARPSAPAPAPAPARPRCWFFLRRPLFGRLCLCLPRAPPAPGRRAPPAPPWPPWPWPPAGRPKGRFSMGSPNEPLLESSVSPKGILPEEPLLLEASAEPPLRPTPSAGPLRPPPPPAPSAEPLRVPPKGLPKGVSVSSESSGSPHGSPARTGKCGEEVVALGRGVRNLQDGATVVLDVGVRAAEPNRVKPGVELGAGGAGGVRGQVVQGVAAVVVVVMGRSVVVVVVVGGGVVVVVVVGRSVVVVVVVGRSVVVVVVVVAGRS
ncbi:Major cell-surface adhesin PAc, partial [Frankliniella fusca]